MLPSPSKVHRSTSTSASKVDLKRQEPVSDLRSVLLLPPLSVMRIRSGKPGPGNGPKDPKQNAFSLNAPLRDNKRHLGWDLSAVPGTVVHAIASGKVVYVGYNVAGYGTVVKQEFDYAGAKFYAVYAHLSTVDPLVVNGSSVGAGQPIAKTGTTGNASKIDPHLHLEIQKYPGPPQKFSKHPHGYLDPAVLFGSPPYPPVPTKWDASHSVNDGRG